MERLRKMSGIAELATIMMSAAQRRMLVTASNLSNMSTPSFRASRVFSHILDTRDPTPIDTIGLTARSGVRGLKATGNPLDLAVDGGAALLLRAGDGYHCVNSVQLRTDGDGRLVDVSGRALQAAGGGDLVVGRGTPEILRDGTVLIDGQAVGRIGFFRQQDGAREGVRTVPEEVEEGVVHQGYLSPADVDPAAEMIELTKAGRLAETGARVFQLYDDVLGNAVRKLGDMGR